MKKIRSFFCLSTLLMFSLCAIASPPITSSIVFPSENNVEPNRTLLPSPFNVFTNGITVINHPAADFIKKLLPTNNDYKGYPGCYIACYSHQKQNSIYAAGDNIFVMGQVRVPGKYEQRICQPTLFKGKDISANSTFSGICKQKIKACKKTHCWAGGDTGGWFGIQP